MQTPEIRDVAIFWDFENCAAASSMSGYSLVENIRNIAHRFGAVKLFKAYLDVAQNPSTNSLNFRSELQSSGVSITDSPHMGQKNVADHMIIVDMFAFAMDHPPPALVILISGDRDFAYAVSTLRLRRYDVVIVSAPVPGSVCSLMYLASTYFDWNTDVLKKSYTSSSHRLSSSSDPVARAASSPLAKAMPSTSPASKSRHYSMTGNDEGLAVLRGETLNGSGFFEFHRGPDAQSVAKSAPLQPEELKGNPNRYTLYSNDTHAASPPRPSSSSLSASSDETLRYSGLAGNLDNLSKSTSKIPLNLDEINEHLGDPHAGATAGGPQIVGQPKDDGVSHSAFCVCSSSQGLGSSTLGNASKPVRTPPPQPHTTRSIIPSVASNASPALARAQEAPNSLEMPPLANPSSSSSNSSSAAPAEPPPQFKSLVEILRGHQKRGNARPSRSVVACELISQDKNAYPSTNSTKFSQYATQAQNLKIVELGIVGTEAWIALTPEYQEKR